MTIQTVGELVTRRNQLTKDIYHRLTHMMQRKERVIITARAAESFQAACRFYGGQPVGRVSLKDSKSGLIATIEGGPTSPNPVVHIWVEYGEGHRRRSGEVVLDPRPEVFWVALDDITDIRSAKDRRGR